jgi:hypothetical protein
MVVRFRIAWFAAAVLGASPVLAGQEADPRAVQARKDCLTGNVDSGVRLLAELFTESKDATHIFNQARCYEQNSRPAEAIQSFKEYLRVAKSPSEEETTEVNRHIAECRAMQAEQDKPQKPVPPPVTQEPSTSAATPAGVDLSAKPAAGDVGSAATPMYKTWWFWTGVGAVVAAGTVTAILLARGSDGPCDGASLSCMGVR